MSFGQDIEVESIDFSLKDNPYVKGLSVEFNTRESKFRKTIFTKPMRIMEEGLFSKEWLSEKLNLIRASSQFIVSLEV